MRRAAAVIGVRRVGRPHPPELPVAMLACARLGVVHSQVFGGCRARSAGAARSPTELSAEAQKEISQFGQVD